MNNTDKLVLYDDESQSFNTLETDFKAEVVASGLKEQGYDPERTLIIREGDMRRGFSKDISHIRTEYSQYDLTDYLHIYVNRKSIYDELPEGLFHQDICKKEKRSKEDVLEEIRIHREEEFFARRFFRPFEIVIDQMLANFQYKERRLDKMNVHEDFINVFASMWPILRLLPLRQAVMFIKMLPFLESITNSLEKISQIMSILLDVPVKAERGGKSCTKVDEALLPGLGEGILGETLVLGNMFDDGTFRILLKIGPVSSKRMSLFMDDSNGIKVLNALKDMLLPADKETETQYIIEQDDALFRLGDEENIAYLGINTYLGNSDTEINQKTFGEL